MTRKEKSKDKGQGSSSGEQMDLLDVGPENLKKIVPVAREYKRVVTQRISLTAKESELKKELQAFAHNSGLKPLPNGHIKWSCQGVTVEHIPQDERVKVTIEKEEEEKE